MLDPTVQVALIAGAGVVGVGVINSATVIIATVLQNKKLTDIGENILRVEVATNSMKTEQVRLAGLVGEAKGRDEERATPTGKRARRPARRAAEASGRENRR